MINGISMSIDVIDADGEVTSPAHTVAVDQDSNVLDVHLEEGNMMLDLDDLVKVFSFYGWTLTPPAPAAGEGTA